MVLDPASRGFAYDPAFDEARAAAATRKLASLQAYDDAYGGSIPSFFSTGVGSEAFLRPNRRRKAILFVNTSANMIYLSKNRAAIIGSGIPLYPNGGFYGEPDNRGRVWLGAWFAIASGAASNLAITEDW